MEKSCPQCGSMISLHLIEWNQKITQCSQCGYDLAQTKIRKIDPTEDYTPYKNFLLKPKIDPWERYLLINLTWLIAIFCDIHEPIFNFPSLTTIYYIESNVLFQKIVVLRHTLQH